MFGTNAFLFRTTTGGIALSDNGTRQTNFYCDSGGSYIGSNDTRSLFLRTNNTTALTLDSSQVGNFEKSVRLKSGSLLLRQVNNTTDRLQLLVGDGTGSTTADDNYIRSVNTVLHFQAGAAGTTEVLTLASNGDLTMASGAALKLGNAYVAGAPTATGYVTIKDSAGNTYKVLVGT